MIFDNEFQEVKRRKMVYSQKKIFLLIFLGNKLSVLFEFYKKEKNKVCNIFVQLLFLSKINQHCQKYKQINNIINRYRSYIIQNLYNTLDLGIYTSFKYHSFICLRGNHLWTTGLRF